jgi:hypothetical protein
MNLQLIANEENQDRAQCRKNKAGWMISFVSRARNHVGICGLRSVWPRAKQRYCFSLALSMPERICLHYMPSAATNCKLSLAPSASGSPSGIATGGNLPKAAVRPSGRKLGRNA